MSAVEADVFGRFRPCFLDLEKQLPHVFVLHAEEPLQGPGTGRIELPHELLTRLTGENTAEEHHLDLKEICPRGNNKVLFISLYHDKCLLFMLELY